MIGNEPCITNTSFKTTIEYHSLKVICLRHDIIFPINQKKYVNCYTNQSIVE